jgi:signal transduction histidine kinase
VISSLARLAQGLRPRRHAGSRAAEAEVERLRRALESGAAQHETDRAALAASVQRLKLAEESAFAQQRRAEAEQARLLVREQRAREDADAATRSRDAFLSKVSHDLRNPLGTIAAAAEVLNRIGGQLPDEVRARDVIRRQIQHLARTIDDLLDVTRILSGKVQLAHVPIDLAAAVQRTATALDVATRFGEHQVEFDLVPAWINGDSVRVDQIVSHLLTNAVKYTPAGGTISVTVAPEEHSVLLTVIDSGIGIAPERLDRIFEPFVRDDQVGGRSQGTFGVGLAFVKRLAELHGGSVIAKSEGEDRGSRFEVRLPHIAPPQRP